MSIKKKILLLIICFVILPILAIPIIETSIYEGILKKKINQSIQQNLYSIANNVEVTVDNVISVSSILCLNPNIKKVLLEGDSEDGLSAYEDYISIENEVSKIVNSTVNIYSADVSIVGMNGMIYSTSPEINNTNYNEIIEAPWFKECIKLNGYMLWIAPLGEESGVLSIGKSNIAIARAIKDELRGICGILIIQLRLEIANRNDLEAYDANTGIYLLNIEHRTISSTISDNVSEELSSEYTSFMTEYSGSFNALMGQKEMIVNYYKIPKTGWKIISVFPRKVIMKEIYELQVINFTLNMVFMSILVVIAIVIASNISNPLHQMHILMEEVSGGNLNVQLQLKGKGEIFRLGEHFNNMIINMKRLISELHSSYNERERLRLEALRAQINPHFLFNTLNSIKWMGRDLGEVQSSKMISALGHLLEATLFRDEELITLSDEIDCIRNYTLLQKMRFGEKFEIRIDISDELLKYKVPSLILQPIIENSIMHGFDSIQSGGVIELQGIKEERKLVVKVSDNGTGIEPERLGNLLKKPGTGETKFSNIGLTNVHERIRLIYGDEYGLEVSSKVGEGTTVLLNLGLKKERNIEC